MASGVFVMKDDDTLVPMEAADFVKEDHFQSLLAKFPELLSGDQIDPSSPRKWILVRREKAIPSEENACGRWSLDLLFLDQDGVPTLVEVKRRRDPRLRREVVGQVLDYAANSVAYWSVEGLQQNLGITSANQGNADALSEFLGPETTEVEFWNKVKTNLEAGHIRILFVADTIPPELCRIIEFMNTQMDPAEVLGVELRQFEGQGLRTLVPRVIGQTQKATRKRNGRQSTPWDKDRILAEIPEADSKKVARRIEDWMSASGGSVSFGSGQRGSMRVSFANKNGVKLSPFTPLILWSNGVIAIPSKVTWRRGPFFDVGKNRRELVRRLNEIVGVNILNDDPTTRPVVRLSTLSSSPSNTETFFKILDWIMDEYRSS